MNAYRPMLARVLPFALFIAFILLGDVVQAWPAAASFDQRLIYPIKVLVVAGVLAYFWRDLTELKVRPPNGKWLWLWAPMVGTAVFVLWINLDFGWLNLAGEGAHGYDPRHPETGQWQWHLVIMRLAGAALLVPLIEELFWRSFLMRWIDKSAFLTHAPAAVTLRAMLISSLIFGFEHTLWFAGILAGLAYAWLYRASGSLWPAILAHGVTNGLLGIWVLSTGNWQFW